MKISTVKTREDIVYCVDMYLQLNDPSFIDTDRERAIKSLTDIVRKKGFVKVIREDSDEIIAWVWFAIVHSLHMPYPVFQQNYYASNQNGIKAARCVKLLHRAAIEEATQLKLSGLISCGSHMDPDYIFAKLLERDGWLRRGYCAIYRLPHRGPETRLAQTVFSRGAPGH